MNRLSHIFIMVLLALMPTVMQAHDDLDLAISKFVSTQNDDKAIFIDKFSSLDSLNGRHAYYYVCYSFTLKGKAKKALSPLVETFRKAELDAYRILFKPINSSYPYSILISTDGLTKDIEFGMDKNKNYQVLAIRDEANPLYRYVYALVYWSTDNKDIAGEIYHIYTRDPNAVAVAKEDEARRRQQKPSTYDSNQQPTLSMDDNGHIFVNGDTIEDDAMRESINQWVAVQNKMSSTNDELNAMTEQMNAMTKQMNELAKEPVKNKQKMEALGKKMGALGHKMDALGDKMNEVSNEMKEKNKEVHAFFLKHLNRKPENNNEERLKTLNNRFGTFYNLYISGLDKRKNDTYMTGLANNIYSLTERVKELSAKPDLKAVWESSIRRLVQLEADTYRKGLLEAAFKNIGK